jgi:hypothetical protein
MNQPPTHRLSSWARLLVLSLLLGVALLAGSLVASSRPAHAQAASSVTITDCSDDSQLQSAISSAASGDTIAFGCSGTITLISTLTISKNLTLDGNGHSVTLDGNNRVDVLFVDNGVSFTLNALTIAHGSSLLGGGLIDGRGSIVNISNSTFANNSATGTATAGFGGGLDNGGGTVNISNSTFANNSASALGGGLENNNGTLTISNSTFANNSAPSGFGGGLLNHNGTLSIGGSIVANNPGGNCSQFGGSITDQGYNLESGTDCGFTGTGDLQNTDPKLDPNGLQNNGGPTQTIALQSTSPAIDQIPVGSKCPANDQRGFTRPNDTESTCDIGAYESGAQLDNDLGLKNLPSNITTNATSPQGAVVTYTPPTAVDEDSSAPAVSCTPASGSNFPIGTTKVTCTATDSDDTNSPVSQSFTVTVKDVTAPTLNLPGPITVNATSPSGASVTYTVTATDPDNPASQLTITCSPASGSTFAIGTTTVNCTASDPSGNSSSGSFQVVVKGAAAQVNDLINLVNSYHLSSSLQNALDNKLQDVLTAINAGQTATACSELTDFIGHVQSQSGKGLTTSQANQLIAAAKQVQAVLGC